MKHSRGVEFQTETDDDVIEFAHSRGDEPSGEGTDDGKAASDPVPDKESAASEETLNRFLEQFFSG